MTQRFVGRVLPVTVLAAACFARADEFTPIQVNFDTGPTPKNGFVSLTADPHYNDARGYGFEKGSAWQLVAHPNHPGYSIANSLNDSFYFSAKVPEGNYRVTVWAGDTEAETAMAIKAESRRIVTPFVTVPKGEVKPIEFVVNVRNAKIAGAAKGVAISDREKAPSVRHWDDKLTLEFVGKHPAVNAIKIEKIDVPTVFLIGDSTVTDGANEPWSAWGQLIPQFFKPTIAIANHAESGRTFKSFKGERRWDKVLSQLKPGDYVFMQFGHNDMKEMKDKGEITGPYTSFSASMRDFLSETRAKGANPVLLTPMVRRKFEDDNVHIKNTFGDYPDAIRKIANEQSVPLIDLQAVTKPMFEAYGPEKSKALVVYFPANTFPGQDKELKDDTHFTAFGAEQIARCVVQGIKDLKLPLAAELKDGIPTFDATKPVDPATFPIPASKPPTTQKVLVPEGR